MPHTFKNFVLCSSEHTKTDRLTVVPEAFELGVVRPRETAETATHNFSCADIVAFALFRLLLVVEWDFTGLSVVLETADGEVTKGQLPVPDDELVVLVPSALCLAKN